MHAVVRKGARRARQARGRRTHRDRESTAFSQSSQGEGSHAGTYECGHGVSLVCNRGTCRRSGPPLRAANQGAIWPRSSLTQRCYSGNAKATTYEGTLFTPICRLNVMLMGEGTLGNRAVSGNSLMQLG